MATLAKLLDRAAGDSAEHRAIREEIRRREINSAADTETYLLFTTEEWSGTRFPVAVQPQRICHDTLPWCISIPQPGNSCLDSLGK